jgi:hypothetical protein
MQFLFWEKSSQGIRWQPNAPDFPLLVRVDRNALRQERILDISERERIDGEYCERGCLESYESAVGSLQWAGTVGSQQPAVGSI